MKRFDFDRRRFLRKASVALGSIGVSPFIKAEIIEKLARQIIPMAGADDKTTGSVTTALHVALRFGYNSGDMFPTTGLADPQRSATANTCTTSVNQIHSIATRSGRPLLLTDQSMALAPYADYITVVSGLNGTDGHSVIWQLRAPMQTSASPEVLFANFTPQTSILPGIAVNSGAVNGNIANKGGACTIPDLTAVPDPTAFKGLFAKPKLKMTDKEIELISNATKNLNKVQQQSLAKTVAGTETAVSASEKGIKLLTTDASTIVDINNVSADLRAQFGVNAPMPAGMGLGVDFGTALLQFALGFSNNLVKSGVIGINTVDWHGFNTPANQARIDTAKYFSDRLAGYLKYMKETPDPSNPGKSMLDTHVMAFSSEFARGLDGVGVDNSDGGQQVLILIGGVNNPGTYGGTRMRSGSEGIDGFDPFTGNTAAGMDVVAHESVYATHASLLGISNDVIDGQVGKKAPQLTCLKRKS